MASRCVIVLALALLQLGLALEHHGGAHYGPKKCVSLSRSSKGTCVLNTHCRGLAEELAHFDFAFVCENHSKKQLHSFGLGGFDEVEEFDTAVECAKCDEPPAEHPHHHHNAVNFGAQRSDNATKEDKQEDAPAKNKTVAKASDDDKTPDDMAKDSKVVNYGPGDCVSTYESTSGTCIVKTDCDPKKLNESWTSYEFGLVCIEADGAPVRHLFGENSFDPVEKFDTLIKCSQCLGLDSVGGHADLAKEVTELAAEVKNMTKDMKDLKDQVKALNKEVGIGGDAEATEADGAASSLVAHKKKRSALRSGKKAAVALKGKKAKKAKKHNKKKHAKKARKHHRHHKEEEEEAEEDDSETDAEDQEEDQDEDQDREEEEEEDREEDEDEEVEPVKEEPEVSEW